MGSTREPPDAIVAAVEDDLREQGWADHTSIRRELANWARVAQSADRYPMTVDDFTNDLCSRDYLEVALGLMPPPARAWLARSVEPLDAVFRDGTVDDEQGQLARFFRIGRESGWWWHRIPRTGPLAAYLAASAQD